MTLFLSAITSRTSRVSIASRGGCVVEGDAVKNVSEFSLETLLRGFERVEIAAVNQCAGNRRGFFEPRALGLQWGHGAMGNARWSGVRLGDVLRRVGFKNGALEVAFDGADAPLVAKTPDLSKACRCGRPWMRIPSSPSR